jgi:HPr kinase/phosphorylase
MTRMQTRHGVLLCMEEIGVLITGNSGIGKSELALELITRGHQLIADDAPLFNCSDDGQVIGECPAALQDFLEIRGLGILDITALFGPAAVAARHRLDLIVHLTLEPPGTLTPEERIGGRQSTTRLCQNDIPTITLSVDPGRNLAVLVETAARNHILKIKGYNSANEFQSRLNKLIAPRHTSSEH